MNKDDPNQLRVCAPQVLNESNYWAPSIFVIFVVCVKPLPMALLTNFELVHNCYNKINTQQQIVCSQCVWNICHKRPYLLPSRLQFSQRKLGQYHHYPRYTLWNGLPVHLEQLSTNCHVVESRGNIKCLDRFVFPQTLPLIHRKGRCRFSWFTHSKHIYNYPVILIQVHHMFNTVSASKTYIT